MALVRMKRGAGCSTIRQPVAVTKTARQWSSHRSSQYPDASLATRMDGVYSPPSNFALPAITLLAALITSDAGAPPSSV